MVHIGPRVVDEQGSDVGAHGRKSGNPRSIVCSFWMEWSSRVAMTRTTWGMDQVIDGQRYDVIVELDPESMKMPKCPASPRFCTSRILLNGCPSKARPRTVFYKPWQLVHGPSMDNEHNICPGLPPRFPRPPPYAPQSLPRCTPLNNAAASPFARTPNQRPLDPSGPCDPRVVGSIASRGTSESIHDSSSRR